MYQIKLKYLITFNPSVSLKSYDSEMLVSFVPMECIKRGYITSKESLISNYNNSYTIFLDGDIVVAKVTPCFENGNIAIASSLINGIGYGSSELFVLRATKCDTKYLFYLLQEESFRQSAISTMTGTGGLKRISSDAIKNYSIQNITLETQQAISDYLDHKTASIDSLIADKQKLIELLKEERQAVISEAVTKGLDKNVKMKDSGIEWIGEIPENWNVINLGKIAQIYTGNTPSKTSSENYYDDDNGLLWVKPDNLSEFKPIDNTKEKLNENGVNLARIVDAYTPLFCCIGTIGKFGYSFNKVAYNQQINAVIFEKSKVFWKYGLYALSIQEEQHYYYSNGTVVQILNTENQKKIKIALPSLEEQKLISNYLDQKTSQIDSLIKDINEQIEKIKEYRQAIISEAVTGKVKII